MYNIFIYSEWQYFIPFMWSNFVSPSGITYCVWFIVYSSTLPIVIHSRERPKWKLVKCYLVNKGKFIFWFTCQPCCCQCWKFISQDFYETRCIINPLSFWAISNTLHSLFSFWIYVLFIAFSALLTGCNACNYLINMLQIA